MSSDAKRNAVRQEAIEQLTECNSWPLKAGMRVICIYRKRSRSGMTQYIDFYQLLPLSEGDFTMSRITHLVAKILGYSWGDDGMKADQGPAECVHYLALACFGDSYKLTYEVL